MYIWKLREKNEAINPEWEKYLNVHYNKDIVHFGALERFFFFFFSFVFFIYLILLLRLSATVGWRMTDQDKRTNRRTKPILFEMVKETKSNYTRCSHLKSQAYALFGILACLSVRSLWCYNAAIKLEKKIRNYCITLYLIYIP